MRQLIAKLMSILGNREHEVIIVGLDNAGKTTILYRFLTNEVVHACPTAGSNVEEIIPRKTHFLMWDLAGQEALHSTGITYYSNTEFSIFVIDSTDRNWLLIAREELRKMLAHKASAGCFCPDLCQQAGREGLHEPGGDLPVPYSQHHQRSLVAYTRLLCPHWGRAASQAPVDLRPWLTDVPA
ncbi:putative ADP-ribosylation factor-like protein 5C [Saimiri boliviensis]|uniref:putative ADP-ribosylation factor-like protein 5C n=1 Tax=Saimiri boliviensis TaxID=27679 RepID=UPI000533DA5F|nr:putative ADP-ribosylation factor-like protein 5C isoform X1 [Saimiri boliviensis boliviensis]